MVTLTRLNGKSFIINALYIEQIESFPDTTITLTNGKKFVVRESEGDVMLSVVNFYRSIQILGLHKHLEEDRFEE
ncbi:flagellar FlbD family protein [Bacillus sp. PS06]|uniref:flagellar FlbD family protein n=1 Tax=Bacillus sp. PS06 TaxID=2764176 RepID=UPI00177B10C1|nr:flagellar FlbD family protein [Bacillus sp. PS06]MBD8068292.1 flagellar FlbD family protein [Bacillus sp. PS06]